MRALRPPPPGGPWWPCAAVWLSFCRLISAASKPAGMGLLTPLAPSALPNTPFLPSHRGYSLPPQDDADEVPLTDATAAIRDAQIDELVEARVSQILNRRSIFQSVPSVCLRL